MRYYWLWFVVILWTIILGSLALFIALFDPTRGKAVSWFTRLWSRFILVTLRTPYQVQGLDLLDPDENYIFAANHSSSIDIPLLFGCLPYWLVPIAKIELKWIPILGWAMQAGGHVFIDRSNHEKAMKSMDEIKHSLLVKPRSILLFPEGSRTLNGEIQPFKPGGLLLGIETGMLIVPIAISGTFESLNKGSKQFKKHKLLLKVGEPINSGSYQFDDRKQLAKDVRDAVLRLKSVAGT